MRILGYIVNCRGNGPMMVSDGKLYFGNYVKLFDSRPEAKAAIKHTIDDRLEMYGLNFEQEFGKLEIHRVKKTGGR